MNNKKFDLLMMEIVDMTNEREKLRKTMISSETKRVEGEKHLKSIELGYIPVEEKKQGFAENLLDRIEKFINDHDNGADKGFADIISDVQRKISDMTENKPKKHLIKRETDSFMHRKGEPLKNPGTMFKLINHFVKQYGRDVVLPLVMDKNKGLCLLLYTEKPSSETKMPEDFIKELKEFCEVFDITFMVDTIDDTYNESTAPFRLFMKPPITCDEDLFFDSFANFERKWCIKRGGEEDEEQKAG